MGALVCRHPRASCPKSRAAISFDELRAVHIKPARRGPATKAGGRRGGPFPTRPAATMREINLTEHNINALSSQPPDNARAAREISEHWGLIQRSRRLASELAPEI